MIIINNQTIKIVRITFARLRFILIASLLSFLIATCDHPGQPKKYIINPANIVTKNKLTEEQKQFIAGFLPKIKYENDLIRIDRERIIQYRDDLLKNKELNSKEKENLNNILVSYDMKAIHWNDKKTSGMVLQRIDSLLTRADIIPIKLVMAQAIIESGWGTSRFAKEGNNYFGIHCFTKGCGMKPNEVTHGKFEVRIFPSISDAIKTYLHILNTGYAYKSLRKIRASSRKQGKNLDPLELAEGLGQYSQIGDKYASIIGNVVIDYLPDNIPELMEEKSD
jgi:Bax protein